MDLSSEYFTAKQTTLPYDNVLETEEVSNPLPEVVADGSSLASRIGSTKVYLLSDASKSRGGKVRWQHVYVG